MNISGTLADAIRPRLHILSTALEQAGHLAPGRGLNLTGNDLLTSDGNSTVDLSPAAQAFVTGWTPPVAPAAPNWGADLLSDDDLMAQAAQAVQQIRAYRALGGTPTEAQRKAYEDLTGRIALHYLRTRFPSL